MITNYVEKLKQYINENEEISTSDFVEIMGVHTSFLILLLILSVLNIILAPLPINSFILGVPLFFFSICYLFGFQKVIFSKKLFNKSVKCIAWRKHIHKVSHYIEKILVISKPRFFYLSQLHRRFISGFILSIIGCYNGFNTTKGAEGVGKATKNAVVSSSILILAANYFLTQTFFN